MTGRPSTLGEVLDSVTSLRRSTGRPIVVGISGYGGSGKSTTANWLAAQLVSSYRLRGDDFLDPYRSHARSTDWHGVERERLVETVLRPFREGRLATFRRFDWSVGRLGPPEHLPETQVLIVDAVGLFHPVTEPFIDLTIWIDVDAATATSRGKVRDRALGRIHDDLWDDVWAPNDRDFDDRFAPRDRADLIVPNA